MTIEAQVERIAKAAAMADPTDLPGLVTLGELFSELIEQIDDPSLKSLVEQASASAGLIERIVMHDIEDLETTFEEINQSIEYAQNIVNAIANQQPIDEIPIPKQGVEDNTPEIDEELLNAWVSGCTDSLADLEAQTLELESGVDEEILAEVRRGIHTLKGECGVLSLATAQKICHEAESLIDSSTADGGAFPVNEILAVLDWLKSYVSVLESDPYAKAPDHDELMQRLTASSTPTPSPETESTDSPAEQAMDNPPAEEEPVSSGTELVEFPSTLERDENLDEFLIEAREHIAAAEGAVLELESNLTDSELINTVFRAFHTIKGVAGFMNLQPIVHTAHNAEFLLDEARKETITLDSSYLDLILSSCDMILQLLAVLDGDPAPLRSEMDDLVSRLQSAAKGEIKPKEETKRSPKHPDPEQLPEPADAAVPAKQNPASPTTPANAPAKKSTGAKKKRADVTVKVNTERLDNLVTMVGELVIAQQMVVQDPSIESIEDQRCQRNLSHSGKIIRDLQEVAMSLRMVTLKGLFQKMARLVRDVSSKAGKNVQFVMEGEDTELDRIVVEEIGDPLVHMIRNSCDHGIENEETRLKAGKDPQGTLTLRAYHQGGSIIIEVEDDGQGLNRDRILTKAIERGIYSPDRELSEISDSEVFGLIMLPGFSTASKVTDISGRGVGMDVVKRNIEALRGKIEIQSTAGKGSIFRMALPLTMAIIDGMIVRVGSQRYVIPTLSIEQSFRPKTDQIHSVHGHGEMASIRGSLLPIFRLNTVFNLNEGIEDISDALLVVLESHDSRCCLLVDEIIGQQQVVIKSLDRGIGSIQGVSGGAILGDGKVALIVDVGGLMNQATQ